MVLCVIDWNTAKVLAKAKIRSFSKRKLSFVTDQGAAMPPRFFAYRQSIGNTENRPLCYKSESI